MGKFDSHLAWIRVKIEKEGIDAVIKLGQGDMRKVINLLQVG